MYKALIVQARLNGKVAARFQTSVRPFEDVQHILGGQGRLYQMFSVDDRAAFLTCAEKHKVLGQAQAALRLADQSA